MSVVLSITLFILFSIAYVGYDAFKVFGFGHAQENGMIRSLPAVFHDAQISVDIAG